MQLEHKAAEERRRRRRAQELEERREKVDQLPIDFVTY